MLLSIQRVNGEVYLQHEYNELNEPTRVVIRWKPEGAISRIPETAFGQSFHSRSAAGSHTITFSNGCYGYTTLAIGGNQQADSIERVPIARPKVRAGIESRYYNGAWQKYSKRVGWVTLADIASPREVPA